jgi:alanine racemase
MTPGSGAARDGGDASPSSLPTPSSPSSTPLRVLRPRRAAPDAAVRPTRAEVDLSALRHNLRVVKGAAGKARVWAVLKADGYGHGAPAVARTLERGGVDGLAVALLEEAIELRDAGIRAPILVMGGYYGSSYEELLAHDLVPVVYDASHFEGLARALRSRGDSDRGAGCPRGRAKVHMKIDTGMSRLGVSLSALDALLEVAKATPNVDIDGVMTHLACADVPGKEGDASIAEQLKKFARGLAKVKRAGVTPRFVHAANSAGTLRSNSDLDARFDAVRPGIALFGVDPLGQKTLKPTLRIRTEVVALRTIESGTPVGYGSTWRASRPTVIATVPIGYADGLARSLSSTSEVAGGSMLVRGKRVPIVGALSMDLATLDVTDVPGVKLRDEVVALGEQKGALGADKITLEEVAQKSGLIPWDVMTSISRRVPRFYREP